MKEKKHNKKGKKLKKVQKNNTCDNKMIHDFEMENQESEESIERISLSETNLYKMIYELQ